MNFSTERHGDLCRALIASGSGALTRRCRARRVRGASVSDLQAVMLACGSAEGHSWRTLAPIGLGIVPGGDERSALLSSSSPITRLAWNAEIVSKGRPQAVYNANRIARANKLGAALPNARLQTCDAASSACNPWYGLAECPARISESSVGWECVAAHFRRVYKSAALRRVLSGPSARLDRLPSVRRGRGAKNGYAISGEDAVRVRGGYTCGRCPKWFRVYCQLLGKIMVRQHPACDRGRKLIVNEASRVWMAKNRKTKEE